MKRNLIRLFAFALAASLAFPATASDTVDQHERWLEADIVIDADGRVDSLQWKKAPGAHLITDKIEPLVRQWQFQPGAIDGVPSVTHTELKIRLVGSMNDDQKLMLRIADASTGTATDVLVLPKYPPFAARDGISASLEAIITVDANGRPTAVETSQYTADSTQDRGQVRRNFVAAAETAVQAWTFTPERVGGRAVPGRVKITIVFCYSGSNWCERQQQIALRESGTFTPAWMPMALDSVVRLLTDLASVDI